MIALGDIFLRSINSQLDGEQSYKLWGSLIAPSAEFGHGELGDSQRTKSKMQRSFLSHRGRANRAFADGHLEAEDLRKPSKATDPELARWNNDHLPHETFLSPERGRSNSRYVSGAKEHSSALLKRTKH